MTGIIRTDSLWNMRFQHPQYIFIVHFYRVAESGSTLAYLMY